LTSTVALLVAACGDGESKQGNVASGAGGDRGAAAAAGAGTSAGV